MKNLTEAQAESRERIAGIRLTVAKIAGNVNRERWTAALLAVVETRRQLGELEAVLKYEAGLVDEAVYLKIAQGTTYGAKQGEE